MVRNPNQETTPSRRTFASAGRQLGLLCCLALPASAFGAFGLTSNTGYYTVDCGSSPDLVFVVNRTNGDLDSVKYNGVEYNDQSKASGIASGLGTPTTVTESSTSSNITIKVQTSSSNSVAANLTHYYIASSGVSDIFMGTYVTAEPGVGELRFIFRGQFNELPNGPADSNNNGNTGAIESTDIFGHSNGQTTSKYYGDQPGVIEQNNFFGATGSGVAAWMYYGPYRESSSSGPFYRDIQDQGDGAGSDQEIYNYMNSGHYETEADRLNVLNGPYALCFTSGGNASAPNMSFIANLGLTGYVATASRGYTQGAASGVDSGNVTTIGWANSNAQYFMQPSGTDYSSPEMKTGSYTMTLYQGELAVATKSVTVNTGANTGQNISSSFTQPTTIWQIGKWDGTPLEFKNGTNINLMHPSDVRNGSWGPLTYTVGGAANTFPAVQFQDANDPTTIKFTLTSAQIANHTIRIGISCAWENGRPALVINSWTSSVPAASTQPSDRCVTVGKYRGNNTIFTYAVPSTAFVVGTNTMTITSASGSGDESEWLSPCFAYDCIELDN
jgi:rhamnogalacturonan endolyase